MSNKDIVRIVWHSEINAYTMNFPYNKDFIEMLKGVIPSSERSYDPSTYTWYIAEKYFEPLVTLMKGNIFPYCQYIIIDKQKVEEYNKGSNFAPTLDVPSELKNFYDLLHEANNSSLISYHEFQNADRPTVQKFYRKAALYFHPDRNQGNESKMSRLNQLWTELKTLYFKEKEEVSV